jgi:hypothetical protein
MEEQRELEMCIQRVGLRTKSGQQPHWKCNKKNRKPRQGNG